jgi:hypothetical protein
MSKSPTPAAENKSPDFLLDLPGLSLIVLRWSVGIGCSNRFLRLGVGGQQTIGFFMPKALVPRKKSLNGSRTTGPTPARARDLATPTPVTERR